MRLPVELRRSLAAVGVAMAAARDPWWIIAGAAVALHGPRPIHVADVDVLLSLHDAQRLLPRLGLVVAPGPASGRFRSEAFATWTEPPLRVEFMADFHRHDGTGWRRVAPETRQPVMVGGAQLFVPALPELTAMLRGFGRPKDLERAQLLDALAEGLIPSDPGATRPQAGVCRRNRT